MAKKIKYFYNTHTLKYEKVELSLTKRILRVIGYLASVAVFASIVMIIAYTYIDSPKEKRLKREIEQLTLQYELLEDQLKIMEVVMTDLQDRDDNIYRVIFEAEPISSDIRKAGFGGVNKYKSLEGYDYAEIMINTTEKLDRVAKQMYVQSKSYDELLKEVKNKNKLLASIPAIQPISNKRLKAFASGFGYRIHPIYKTSKMHTGMDFTAAIGTPIYATGDGYVSTAELGGRGYGNHVVINHGYGYQTLYAHMSRIKARRGQSVKRGEIIGYVGNTGTSTAPHLHYEVRKGGRPINPINFYYNDLTPAEYETMLKISQTANQSFD
jgi:murein DD-endopeptidase MepM/ murein hydrolase activator NlpD